MPKRKTIALAVVSLLVLISLGFFGGLFDISASAPSDYDPNTKIIKSFAGGNSGFLIGGFWDDPAYTTTKQLLDSPQYITSYKPTGNSEAMVPTANLFMTIVEVRAAHWEYWTSTGGPWALVKSTPAQAPSILGGGSTTMPPPNPLYYLVGETNGWIRVQFVAEIWSPGPNIFDGNLVNDYREGGAWIRDDAVLVSGRGTITSPAELTVFAVGDKISITVDIGSACSGKVSSSGIISTDSGYTLELSSDGQGHTVKTWDLACGPGTFSIDKTGARLEYIVQSVDFTKESGCRNTITLKLLNNLFLKDQTDLKTVDLRQNQPDPPRLTAVLVEGTVWEEGKVVRITVETTSDALVNLVAEYEGTGVSLLRKDGVIERTFDITPPVAGVIKITASVVIDCASSNTVEATLVIKEKEPIDYTENGQIGNLLWLIILIIGILFILAAIFIPFLDMKWRIVLLLIGVGLIGLGLILVGVL